MLKSERVRRIEIIDELPDYVYNIEVEGNHNYFVNGILTHNCDDPQDPKLAASEVERKNTIDFFSGTLYSRLNQPDIGQRIIVQQRLHTEDLSGYLLENFPKSYDHICIPAELDEEILKPNNLKERYIDNLFWPDRFSHAIINDFKTSLGSRQAAGQLQQRPVAKEGNMVREDWFDIVDPMTVIRDPVREPLMFYIDTAESEKEKTSGDSTGIVTAFRRGEIVYIANVVELKEEFFNLVKVIPEFCYANQYTERSKIKIEPKSSGKSVVSQLRGATQLNVMELPNPNKDKITRLSLITPKLEARRVKLLKGNYIQPFMQQLTSFPYAKHDDMTDAFVHCITDLLLDSDFDFAFA